MNVIGLDIGHSAVKISLSQTHRILFPSVVGYYKKISDEKTAFLAERETVEYKDKKYFVGDTARLQSSGAVLSGCAALHSFTDTLLYKH